MPRATSTKSKPGTERYRDERRKEGGPRMHGRDWHDHSQPKEYQPEAMAGADAVPDVESGGEHAGMGRVRSKAATSQGRVRRKRTTPVGKGTKAKTKNAVGARRGAKGTNRAGNPG